MELFCIDISAFIYLFVWIFIQMLLLFNYMFNKLERGVGASVTVKNYVNSKSAKLQNESNQSCDLLS